MAERQFRIPTLETFAFQQQVKSVETTPPIAPSRGDRYIVGTGAVGAWAGQDNKVVYCSSTTDPKWTFDDPQEGWLSWVEDIDSYYSFNGVSWTSLSIQKRGQAVYVQEDAPTDQELNDIWIVI